MSSIANPMLSASSSCRASREEIGTASEPRAAWRASEDVLPDGELGDDAPACLTVLRDRTRRRSRIARPVDVRIAHAGFPSSREMRRSRRGRAPKSRRASSVLPEPKQPCRGRRPRRAWSVEVERRSICPLPADAALLRAPASYAADRMPTAARDFRSSALASVSSSRPSICGDRARPRASALAVSPLADQLAVAQHRDAVGDLEDLIEEMRDEHDRDPLGASAVGSRRRAARPRRSSRLDVGSSRISTSAEIDRNRARDRDHLLHRERDSRREKSLDIDLERAAASSSVRAACRIRAQAMRITRHRIAPLRGTRLATDVDVLRHREVGAEIHFLVDGADAEPRCASCGVVPMDSTRSPLSSHRRRASISIRPRQAP